MKWNEREREICWEEEGQDERVGERFVVCDLVSFVLIYEINNK